MIPALTLPALPAPLVESKEAAPGKLTTPLNV